MRTMFRTMVLAVLAVGCTADLGGETTASSRQWLCETDGSQITCTAAIPAEEGEEAFYACSALDRGRACPPPALSGDLAEDVMPGYRELFHATPWACLLTGAHQRHCLKDLERTSTMALTREGDPSGGEYTPAPDDGSLERPDAPPDCAVGSWEAYFCAHATYSYRSHGVDITFPCDIFDAEGEFPLPDRAALAGAGPSCHDGEWAMRNDAWLDAASVGCVELSGAITVMCQQAANHAPASGACAATGTW